MMDARWLLGRTVLVSCILLAFSLSGCILEDRSPYDDPEYRDFFREPFDYPTEPVGLEVTGILIEQDQRSGPTTGLYMGTIETNFCMDNPNGFYVVAQMGHEIYQVMGPPNSGEPRLIDSSDTGQRDYKYDRHYIPLHHVLYNETVEGNSTDYRIHFWHQIYLSEDEPAHREDLWFNVTFTPYGPEETLYEEGEPCW